MGLAASPLAVLVVRAADRFGKGIRSAPRDALVADLVGPAERGRAFGHIRAMDHAGAAIGPLAAVAFLLVFPGRERTLFLLALLPGLATLAVIWRFVNDPPRRTPVAPHGMPAPAVSGPQKRLLSSVAVWALGASSEQFLLLRAAELGVALSLIPLVWFGIGLAKTVAARAAGRLVDRWHPQGVLAAGWLLFAAAYGGLAWSRDLSTLLPLIGIVGIAYGLFEPAERALVALLAPAGGHGAAFGWYALVQGLLAVPAGLLAGWLWQQEAAGPAAAFAATAVLATLACLGLVAVGPPRAGARRLNSSA
jgi:MFS family permease